MLCLSIDYKVETHHYMFWRNTTSEMCKLCSTFIYQPIALPSRDAGFVYIPIHQILQQQLKKVSYIYKNMFTYWDQVINN